MRPSEQRISTWAGACRGQMRNSQQRPDSLIRANFASQDIYNLSRLPEYNLKFARKTAPVTYTIIRSTCSHSTTFDLSPPTHSNSTILDMSNLTTTTSGNQTLIDNPDLCTLQTCDLSLANFTYIPNLAGNALFLAIFVLLFVAHAVFGTIHRMWGFMTTMLCGLVCITSQIR